MIRYLKAYSLRISGKKLREIGYELNVSVERARQMVLKGRRVALKRQRMLEAEIENAQGTNEQIAREFITNIKKIRRINKL